MLQKLRFYGITAPSPQVACPLVPRGGSAAGAPAELGRKPRPRVSAPRGDTVQSGIGRAHQSTVRGVRGGDVAGAKPREPGVFPSSRGFQWPRRSHQCLLFPGVTDRSLPQVTQLHCLCATSPLPGPFPSVCRERARE